MKHRKQLGFSLIELLAIVGAVGILASVGYVVLSNANKNLRAEKLKSEVATLNSAVGAYLGFGGNLDSAKTPDDVISKLQTVTDKKIADRIPGLSASMIDPRIRIRYQNDKETASDDRRAYWNGTSQRFELANSGKEAGIAEFYLIDESKVGNRNKDTRTFTELYAAKDTWVWDYDDNSAALPEGPGTVATTDPGTTSPPASGGGKPPGSGSSGSALDEPLFSIPAGSYSILDFTLPLTLTNPNPAGSSDVYYQVDFGSWQKYTAGTIITVSPEETINAQSVATSSDWSDSSRASNQYLAKTEKLKAPIITTSADTFGVFDNRLVGVAIDNPNKKVDSKLMYQIGGGPWLDYNGFILLDRADFSNGVVINAIAVSNDPYYTDSESSFDAVGADSLALGGVAAGNFKNPSSPVDQLELVTNLNDPGTESDYFEWGRIVDELGNPYQLLDPLGVPYQDFTKSWMDFDGFNLADIELGEQVLIGDLDYFNGSFLADTGANSVNLALDLALNIGGINYNTLFDYQFDLVNTLNDNADTKGWASADYVKIDYPNSTTTFEIDGLTFELVLEFGNASTNGFASFDEFHVIEGESASSNLYATIYDRTASSGTVDGSGNSTDVDTEEAEAIAADLLSKGKGYGKK